MYPLSAKYLLISQLHKLSKSNKSRDQINRIIVNWTSKSETHQQDLPQKAGSLRKLTPARKTNIQTGCQNNKDKSET